MASQSLARSQSTRDIMPQGTPGSPVQLTESHIRQMAQVTQTILVETDLLHNQVEAYVTKPGRSAANQQSIEGFGALLTNNFDRAAIAVQAQAFQRIVANLPREVAVTRIVEVPQKGLLPRLLGR
jgi:hypothetical protein